MDNQLLILSFFIPVLMMTGCDIVLLQLLVGLIPKHHEAICVIALSTFLQGVHVSLKTL